MTVTKVLVAPKAAAVPRPEKEKKDPGQEKLEIRAAKQYLDDSRHIADKILRLQLKVSGLKTEISELKEESGIKDLETKLKEAKDDIAELAMKSVLASQDIQLKLFEADKLKKIDRALAKKMKRVEKKAKAKAAAEKKAKAKKKAAPELQPTKDSAA